MWCNFCYGGNEVNDSRNLMDSPTVNRATVDASENLCSSLINTSEVLLICLGIGLVITGSSLIQACHLDCRASGKGSSQDKPESQISHIIKWATTTTGENHPKTLKTLAASEATVLLAYLLLYYRWGRDVQGIRRCLPMDTKSFVAISW